MTGDLAGFLFSGAGVLPGFILYADQPALAIVSMFALLLAGCVAAIADPDAPFRTMKGSDTPQRDR